PSRRGPFDKAPAPPRGVPLCGPKSLPASVSLSPSCRRSPKSPLGLDQLQAGARRVAALAADAAFGPRQCLGARVYCQNSVTDRHFVAHGGIHKPVVCVVADYIIMRRLTANDTSKRNRAVECQSAGRTRRRSRGQSLRNFERTRNCNTLKADATLGTLCDGSLGKHFGDVLVKSRL